MNGSLPMRVFGGLVAALIVVAGLVFTASLLVGVLVLGAVAVVAAALRGGGEKPRFGFHWGRGPTGPSTVVIDIEAREVEDAPPATIDHRPEKQRSEP
jgi:hypothetical protein